MSSTLIRPIAPADDAAVAAIIRTCLEAYRLDIPGTAYFDPELDHLSRFYASRPGCRAYFVMEDADTARILGGAGLAEYEGLDACCELQKIYLVESKRGRGLGRALLDAVEGHAHKLGYRRVYLETHTSLHEAVRLYERCGYRRVDRPATAIHSPMDLFYLKNL